MMSWNNLPMSGDRMSLINTTMSGDRTSLINTTMLDDRTSLIDTTMWDDRTLLTDTTMSANLTTSMGFTMSTDHATSTDPTMSTEVTMSTNFTSPTSLPSSCESFIDPVDSHAQMSNPAHTEDAVAVAGPPLTDSSSAPLPASQEKPKRTKLTKAEKASKRKAIVAALNAQGLNKHGKPKQKGGRPKNAKNWKNRSAEEQAARAAQLALPKRGRGRPSKAKMQAEQARIAEAEKQAEQARIAEAATAPAESVSFLDTFGDFNDMSGVNDVTESHTTVDPSLTSSEESMMSGALPPDSGSFDAENMPSSDVTFGHNDFSSFPMLQGDGMGLAPQAVADGAPQEGSWEANGAPGCPETALSFGFPWPVNRSHLFTNAAMSWGQTRSPFTAPANPHATFGGMVAPFADMAPTSSGPSLVAEGPLLYVDPACSSLDPTWPTSDGTTVMPQGVMGAEAQSPRGFAPEMPEEEGAWQYESGIW